jgi:hypothetical protein
MRTHRPLRNVLLLALVAALCFGGSFTCNGSTHDNDNPPSTGVSGGVNAR